MTGKIYLTKREIDEFGMGKIKFTNREKSVIKSGKNGVGNVNWRWIPFLVGFLIALALPFLIDYALFGNAMPCETVKTFEDGSSVQKCSVRN